MAKLPPQPVGVPPGSSYWNDWYEKLRLLVEQATTAVINFVDLNFTGSNLTSIQTRNHNDLQNIQGGAAGEYNHLTNAQVAAIAAIPVGANPTATVGTVAVNGTANTWMRSDGAPAINQAISPTWTGTHTFNNTIVGNISGSAPAGSLTGAALPAGVTASSLTSVGTLTSLTVGGNTVLGDAQTDTLNVGAGDLIKDASGNFGIGVAPTTKLDVFGGYTLIRNASYQLYLGTGTLTTGAGAANPCIRSDTGDIYFSFGGTTRAILSNTGLLTTNSTTLHATSVALANGAGAGAGTITNAPAAGNPTKWIPINDNGTTRYIPAW